MAQEVKTSVQWGKLFFAVNIIVKSLDDIVMCRGYACQFWRIKGVAWSAQRIPTAVNLDFLDPVPLLSHSSSSLVLTSPSGGGRSVDIFRLRSKATV
jgi:hypothetical protein